MTIKRIIISSFLALMLTACMGIKFTYNNLDWFIPWYLNDYLLLDRKQENTFDRHLEILWNWHRKQELPEYSNLLYTIIEDLDKQQVSHEKLYFYSSQAGIFYDRIIAQSLQQGTPFIASLNDQQLSDMLDSIADDDQDFKEYVADTDLQERIKERRKSISKTFRKWIGRLSKQQKKLIRLWSKEAETTLEHHVEYITNTRSAFKNVLLGRKNQQQTRRLLLELATHPELFRSVEYNNVIERNSQRFRQLLIDTLSSLSKKQQQRLRKKILNYAEDFSTLSIQTISN